MLTEELPTESVHTDWLMVLSVFARHIIVYAQEAASAGLVAEWWLHSRPHTAGHQLHYDTDEASLRRKAGVHCPLVSSVLYDLPCPSSTLADSVLIS